MAYQRSVLQNIFSLEDVYLLQELKDWPTLSSYNSVGMGYGYFGGGRPTPDTPFSTIDRIDYTNDTATASVRGSLSVARQSLAATGNQFYGYFGGGQPAPYKSTVDRIDYSNDTATASVRGPLSFVNTFFASCSARANAVGTAPVVL